MKQEQIIEFAKKAECYESHSLPSDWDEGDWIASLDQLALFASLVEQATLDKIKREITIDRYDDYPETANLTDWGKGWCYGAKDMFDKVIKKINDSTKDTQ